MGVIVKANMLCHTNVDYSFLIPMVVSIDTALIISMGLVSVPQPKSNARADWFHMIQLWGIDIQLLAGCKGSGITRV